MHLLPPISALFDTRYPQVNQTTITTQPCNHVTPKRVAIEFKDQKQTFELSNTTTYKDLLQYASDHWNVDCKFYELRNEHGDILVGTCTKSELYLVPKLDENRPISSPNTNTTSPIRSPTPVSHSSPNLNVSTNSGVSSPPTVPPEKLVDLPEKPQQLIDVANLAQSVLDSLEKESSGEN